MFGNVNHLTECETFENISNRESHRIEIKWIEWKIFELEYGNRKLLNVSTCIFDSTVETPLTIKDRLQATVNQVWSWIIAFI